MKKLFIGLFSLACLALSAQGPTCPNNQVYIHSGSSIMSQQVPLPGPAATVMSNLPSGSGGLAVGPNFGFPAPNPTYWTTSGGTYWYYNNGGTWTNTGHSTGNSAAVNLGAGGGFMYNLVGGTGQIYVYNGTGPGTLLVTLAGFSGGGPYDVVCDAAGNFFILKNTSPQSLSMYGPNGVLKCSWSLANNPQSSAGGGFAIVGSTVYYHNGSFYAGNIVPGSSTITFSPQASIASPSDFASCPIPIPTGSIQAPQGGTLTCSLPQLNLIAIIIPGGIAFSGTAVPSSSNASCTFTWTGPGIIAGQGTATITVNQPGVYSYTTCAGSGCPSYSVSASFTVVGQGSVITPTLTAPTCITNGGQISVLPNTATNTITWTGPGITSGQGTATININAPGLYSVSITNTVNACAGTGSIVVNQTPTVNLSLSSNTFCSQNFNTSPNTTTVAATGASSYTWSASAGLNFVGNSTGGPFTIPPAGNVLPGTYTIGVIGSNGVCTNSAVTTVSVLPNPTVTAAPAATSICQGTAYTFTANGAFTYTWFPGTGLNTTNGSVITANPNSTTTYSVIGQVGGCFSSTQSVTLTVLPNPTISLTPPSPTICAGSSINLNANGATAYTWSPAGSLSTSLGSIVTAAPSSNQTYTVIGSMNTCTGTSMITLTVIPVPSLNISATQGTVCQGSSVYLSVNGATSFSWTPSSGLNATIGTNVIATPSATTVYTVVGNNGLCTGTGSYSVVIVPRPNMTIDSPNTFICEGTSTQIFATGAQNFDWSPASSLSSASGSVVTATPLVSTNYSVVGYNTLGSVTCSEAHSYSIVVIPNAQAIVSPPAVICKGDKTTLTVTGGSTYTWMPSLGLSSTTGSVITASPDTTITYTVFSSFDGNCGTTGHVTILVNPLPSVYAGRDTTFNLDAYKSIKATGTGTLTWIEGDEIWCRVCPETQIMPTRNNCYTIMAENEFGCKNTDEVCVEVTLDFGVYIPNAITPNGDGLNDEFFVYGYGITNVHVNIFDRWGEKLFTSPDQTVGWNGTYKGKNCQNDVYVYKVDYKGLDGKVYHRTGHVTLNR